MVYIKERSDLESRPVKQMYGAVLQREETLVKVSKAIWEVWHFKAC